MGHRIGSVMASNAGPLDLTTGKISSSTGPLYPPWVSWETNTQRLQLHTRPRSTDLRPARTLDYTDPHASAYPPASLAPGRPRKHSGAPRLACTQDQEARGFGPRGPRYIRATCMPKRPARPAHMIRSAGATPRRDGPTRTPCRWLSAIHSAMYARVGQAMAGWNGILGLQPMSCGVGVTLNCGGRLGGGQPGVRWA